MRETFSRWDAAEYLNTDEDIAQYLDACIRDDAGDGRLIQAALGDIARARNMTELARSTGMSREGLYKALSNEGNPSFSTILKVARALGMDVHFRPAP
jgi:probable addiction module antidote protein